MGGPKCCFCDCLSPSSEHLTNEHNYLPCSLRHTTKRRYFSERAIIHHLEKVHSAKIHSDRLSEQLRNWKQLEPLGFGLWRCRICLRPGITIVQLLQHIHKHWVEGCKVEGWVGVDPDMIPLSAVEYDAVSRLHDHEFRAYAAERLPRNKFKLSERLVKRYVLSIGNRES